MSQAAYVRSGFTLVELIIVLGIFTTVLASTLPFLGRFQQTETLDTEVQELVQTFRRAQNRAVNGRRNSDWGVRILSGSYALFAGSTYATRNSAFDELHDLQLNYTLSGSGEIVFLRQSGTATAAGQIVLREDTAGTGSIIVQQSGRISSHIMR